MKILSKNTIRFFIFVLICTLWVGIFFILPEFIDNPSKGFNGFLIITGHWGLICMATFFLLYLAIINKYVFALSFPLFSLLGATLAFYRYAFKATLTPMLIDASLNNDLRTSLDVISAPLIFYILICLIISVLLVWFRFKYIELNYQFRHIFISLLLLWLIFSVNGRARNSIDQRFPFSVYTNFKEYYKLHKHFASIRINPDSTLKLIGNDSLNIILVIGETLRADHLSLNGYSRATNPRLSVRRNVVSYPRIYSEYVTTNPSLAHILTRADSANTERAYNETSFVPLFKAAGFKSAWITNQDAEDAYIDFMNECDTLIYCHPEKSIYNYNSWLDEDLLPNSNSILEDQSSNNLLILHTIGSHWYYNNHYSKQFEIFKPITSSRIVAQCSPEEIINSYDNSAVYTDYFLDKLIQKLEHKNAIVIYLSDHGEALGEGGAWLHAADNAASHNPACIVWYSDRFKARYPDKAKAINKNKNKHFRSDFLFNSILSAGNIPTTIIDEKLNILN